MNGLARALALVAALAVTGPARAADPTYTVLDFDELRGWESDDQADALQVFKETCPDMRDPDWLSLCALATNQKNARTFFELFFRPVLIEDGDDNRPAFIEWSDDDDPDYQPGESDSVIDAIELDEVGRRWEIEKRTNEEQCSI